MHLPWWLFRGYLGENVYHAVVGWSFLKVAIKTWWLMVLSSLISLLIFCLISLSVAHNGILEVPKSDCGFVYFSLSFIIFASCYFVALLFGMNTLRIYTHSKCMYEYTRIMNIRMQTYSWWLILLSLCIIPFYLW